MAKKKTATVWNTVTPLSKTIAMGMLIILPFLGFYLGIQYQKIITPNYPSTEYTPEQKAIMKQDMLPTEAAQSNQMLCTQEAKLCPDGSYVGRTGPHCEFAACPHK